MKLMPCMILIVLIFFYSTSLWGEGFAVGTLVKIPHEYAKIEELQKKNKEHDYAISMHFLHSSSELDDMYHLNGAQAPEIPAQKDGFPALSYI